MLKDEERPQAEDEHEYDEELHIPEEEFVVPEVYSEGEELEDEEGPEQDRKSVVPMDFPLDNGQYYGVPTAVRGGVNEADEISYLHDVFEVTGGNEFSYALKEEVIAFQAQFNLKSDGRVGLITWNEIQKELVK